MGRGRSAAGQMGRLVQNVGQRWRRLAGVLVALMGVAAQDCRDFDHSCAYWASIGECKANPTWMKNNCRLSCAVCGSNFPDRDPRYRSLEMEYIGGGGIITAQPLKTQVGAPGNDPPLLLKEAADKFGDSIMVEVNFSPRIYVVDDLISDEEAEYLKKTATPELKQSLTINRTTGYYEVDKVRTNRQMSFTKEQVLEDDVIRNITRRLHRLARVPLSHAEQLQVGHYAIGEKYEPHFDSEQAQYVLRAATVIMYLSDVSAGGHTVFPMASGCPTLKECCVVGSAKAKGALLVAPRKLRGVLFYSHDLTGKMNTYSRHGSCPVVKLEDAVDEVGAAGAAEEKWISQQWFRTDQYSTAPHFRDLSLPDLPDGTTTEAAVEL